MRKNQLFTIILVLCSGLTSVVNAQPLAKGLLWEITGNGLTKPSYLYGTMHVSSKLAFNLSDSFFIALKSVDKVALESTPENWLEEFLTTDFLNYAMRNQAADEYGGENAITISKLEWFKKFYSKEHIKQSLSEDPALINQLMFRHTSNKQDFEEDTYLDLYIFQTASRLGKPVVSVEGLEESLKLVMKAYTEMFDEDKEKKYNPNFDELLEEYYRQMDLNKVDSLMQKQGYSKAYFENMLYIRNSNMVGRMDSLMRIGALFTGVGAAHLPGEKGVIRLLTNMGYRVRAVNLGYRNAQIRSKIDNIKVPVVYQKYQSADGTFSVEVPGKLLTMPGNGLNQQYIYTDMMNGSFYRINRIRSLAPFINISEASLLLTIDSLLYENIPGDIITKKEIMVDGYRAFDITNKNKRGNFQRYRVVVTPFEVFVLKAGGNGNYIKKNGEQFITSFKLYPSIPLNTVYESKQHGFTIAFPNKPLLNYEASNLKGHAPNIHMYTSADANQVTYALLHETFINTNYFEEDTVELNLVARGITSGLNLKEVNRSYASNNGYPMLQCNYSNLSDSLTLTAYYAIKGSHVYVLLAWYKNETGKQQALKVLNSFKLTQVVSNNPEKRTDTSHFFTVNSSVPLPPDVTAYTKTAKQVEKSKFDDAYEAINCYDAETGERVLVDWQRVNQYYQVDTADFWKMQWNKVNGQKTFNQKVTINNNAPVPHGTIYLTDTNSSRMLMVKVLVKGRNIYTLTVHTDTLTQGNNFQREFLSSFASTDTSNFNIFESKSAQLLTDLVSKDSATYAQARNSYRESLYPGKDYKKIAETIERLKDDKYKNDLKENLTNYIGDTKDTKAIPYLKAQYQKSGDDYDVQFAILNALVKIKTKEAYQTAKELLLKQPPFATNNYKYQEFSGALAEKDSTWMRKLFLPDVLKLAQYEEYRDIVYELLAEAIDSNKITLPEYESYLNSIIIDAKKVLVKELTNDKENNNAVNYELVNYNHLLIKHINLPQVKEYFDKQLKVKNKLVKISALAFMLANNRTLPDTIMENLAKDINTRYSLFQELNKNKIAHKMPAQYSSQQQLVDAYVYNAIKPTYGDEKVDTFIMLQRQKSYFKGKTGWVYFYKWKLTNTDEWSTYVCGMQTPDTANFTFIQRLNGKGNNTFVETDNVESQFVMALEERKEVGRNNQFDFGFMEQFYPQLNYED